MKRILLLLLAATATIVLLAQPKVTRTWDFGVMGGATLSKYNFYPTATQDQATGYLGGVAVRYIEEKYFGLEAELLLTKRGMKDRFDEEHQQYSFQRNLTYLELPVQAHVYFNLGSRSEISLDLGPKLGYFLGDSYTSQLDETFADYASLTRHKYAHHDMEVSRKVDYGIQVGLGYEFRFNRNASFQLLGRYYFGLGNIFPDAKGNYFEESSNRGIQIAGILWFRHRIRIKAQ